MAFRRYFPFDVVADGAVTGSPVAPQINLGPTTQNIFFGIDDSGNLWVNDTKVGGGPEVNYDSTQVPGSDSTTQALVIGPAESTLDPFIKGSWTPLNTLFTSNCSAGVGYDQAIGVEASGDGTPFGGVTGLGSEAVLHNTADGTDKVTGIIAQSYHIGTKNALQATGITVSAIASSSGTLSNLIGVEATVGKTAGTVLVASAIYVRDIHGSGALTAAFHNLNQGAGATDYAFYSEGGRFRIDNTPVPASAGAAGTAGQIAWDSGFIYVCINTNTWKRSAISTW